MVETHDHFTRRLTHIGARHAQMDRGHAATIRHDGLMAAIPRRRAPAFPCKIVVGLLLGCFAFKALLLVALGPVTYNERLATLENGGPVERIGAAALRIDPLTDAIADFSLEVLR